MPDSGRLRLVVRYVHRTDPVAAAKLAAAAQTTLEELGVGLRVVVGALSPANAVELLVSAAADAFDLSPRLVRPALIKAFRRAREMGASLEALDAGLVESP
jgi:hypothetical protein